MARDKKTKGARPKAIPKQKPSSKATTKPPTAVDPEPTDLDESAPTDSEDEVQVPVAEPGTSKKGKAPITQQQEDVQVAKRTLRQILTQVETDLNTNSSAVFEFVAGLNAALAGPDGLEGLAATIAQGLDGLGDALGNGEKGSTSSISTEVPGLAELLRDDRWKITLVLNNNCCKTIILKTTGQDIHAAPIVDDEDDGQDGNDDDYIVATDNTGRNGKGGSQGGAARKRRPKTEEGGPAKKKGRNAEDDQSDKSTNITAANPLMSGAIPDPSSSEPQPKREQSPAKKPSWHIIKDPTESNTAGTTLDINNILDDKDGNRPRRNTRTDQCGLVRRAVQNVAAAASAQANSTNVASAKGSAGQSGQKAGKNKKRTRATRAPTPAEKTQASFNPKQSFPNLFEDRPVEEAPAAGEDETDDDDSLNIGSLPHLPHADIRHRPDGPAKGAKGRGKDAPSADKARPTKEAEIVDLGGETTEGEVNDDVGLGWEGVENRWLEEDTRADEDGEEEFEPDVEKGKRKGGLKRTHSGATTASSKRKRVSIAEHVEESPSDVEARSDEGNANPQDPRAPLSDTEPTPYSIPPYKPTGYKPLKVKTSAKILSPRSSQNKRKSSFTARSLYSQAKDDSNRADEDHSAIEEDADLGAEPSGTSESMTTGLSGGRNTRIRIRPRIRPWGPAKIYHPPTPPGESSSSSGGASHVSADSYQASGVTRPSLSELPASTSAKTKAAVKQIEKYVRGEEEEREDEYVPDADAGESDGGVNDDEDDESDGKDENGGKSKTTAKGKGEFGVKNTSDVAPQKGGKGGKKKDKDENEGADESGSVKLGFSYKDKKQAFPPGQFSL